jgi:hypothetical protein
MVDKIHMRRYRIGGLDLKLQPLQVIDEVIEIRICTHGGTVICQVSPRLTTHGGSYSIYILSDYISI